MILLRWVCFYFSGVSSFGTFWLNDQIHIIFLVNFFSVLWHLLLWPAGFVYTKNSLWGRSGHRPDKSILGPWLKKGEFGRCPQTDVLGVRVALGQVSKPCKGSSPVLWEMICLLSCAHCQFCLAPISAKFLQRQPYWPLELSCALLNLKLHLFQTKAPFPLCFLNIMYIYFLLVVLCRGKIGIAVTTMGNVWF